jgi:hypothetical protein
VVLISIWGILGASTERQNWKNLRSTIVAGVRCSRGRLWEWPSLRNKFSRWWSHRVDIQVQQHSRTRDIRRTNFGWPPTSSPVQNSRPRSFLSCGFSPPSSSHICLLLTSDFSSPLCSPHLCLLTSAFSHLPSHRQIAIHQSSVSRPSYRRHSMGSSIFSIAIWTMSRKYTLSSKISTE